MATTKKNVAESIGEELTEDEQLFDEGVEIEGDLNLWKPEKTGELLVGEIIAQDDNKAGYGLSFCVKKKDGSIKWTPGHSWLQNRVKGAFKIGDGIAIKCDVVGDKNRKIAFQYTVKRYDVKKA
jgi:hypothetical protein